MLTMKCVIIAFNMFQGKIRWLTAIGCSSHQHHHGYRRRAKYWLGIGVLRRGMSVSYRYVYFQTTYKIKVFIHLLSSSKISFVRYVAHDRFQGYTGFSCEHCAPGYLRRESGPWLGQCYRDEPPCPPGYYGDPSRNIPCQICPCPLTNPSNQ